MNKDQLLFLLPYLLSTPKVSILVMVDKSEWDSIENVIISDCLHNKINNTFRHKNTGTLTLKQNANFLQGRKFDHVFSVNQKDESVTFLSASCANIHKVHFGNNIKTGNTYEIPC